MKHLQVDDNGLTFLDLILATTERGIEFRLDGKAVRRRMQSYRLLDACVQVSELVDLFPGDLSEAAYLVHFFAYSFVSICMSQQVVEEKGKKTRGGVVSSLSVKPC